MNETQDETLQIKKLIDYVERIVPGYSKTTFKEHFRVFPDTFQMIINLLKPALNATNARGSKYLQKSRF